MRSETAPEGLEAHIRPEWFSDGDPVRIEISNARPLAGRHIVVEIHATNAFENVPLLQIPIEIDENGSGLFSLDSGFDLGCESSVYVHALIERAGEPDAIIHVFEKCFMSIANATTRMSTLGDVADVHARLLREQQATYSRTIGEPSANDAREHRALCVVEGLLISSELRLPGITIRPLGRALNAEEERAVVNEVVRQMGWATHLRREDWGPYAESRRPLALMIFHEVYASTYERAADLVREERARVLALLALNRQAQGRSICLVLEQRLDNGGVLSRWVPESRAYVGNLIGGSLAGESQHLLYREWQALNADPLLEFCCNLFGETLAHETMDAQYLRFWSILEFLSGGRVQAGKPVTLRNGDPWPDSDHNTTSYAKPRVYHYLAQNFDKTKRDEASFCQPARDLYEAVQVWYARRNATGHYGRFVAGNDRQARQSWYKHAAKSAGDDAFQWLLTLRLVVIDALHKELSASTAGAASSSTS